MSNELNVATKDGEDLIFSELSRLSDLVETVIPKYGVKINKNDSNPNTRVTYLYDAVGKSPAAMNFSTGVFNYGDWEDVWFVKGNYPCMVKYDGTEDYPLNPNDYTKKKDGTASDVTDLNYGGNAMATIPLAYLYLYEDENYHYFIISSKKINHNYKQYAHINADGRVVDKIYLGIYEGYVSGGKLRSMSTGQIPTGGNSMTNEMAYAQANGANVGWDVRSWAQRVLLNVELAIMAKSTNTQAVYGLGNAYNNVWEEQYCTVNGLGNAKGQFWGENVGTKAANAVVKTFHIENWWGNKWDRLTGLLQGGNVGKGIRVKMTPPYNRTGSGYTLTLAPVSDWANNEGFIKDGATSTEYGFIPYMIGESGASDSTYWADYNWQYAKERYNLNDIFAVVVGGACDNGGKDGAWAFHLYDSVGNASWHLEACLSLVPRL